MPELPEVETVRRVLVKKILQHTIKNVILNLTKVVKDPSPKTFCSQLKAQTIYNVKRQGKNLLFELDDYVLISHLRMEGKYYFFNASQAKTIPWQKHDLVIFIFSDQSELRYNDFRRFGTMHLYPKDSFMQKPPLSKLGLEIFDLNLTGAYLKQSWANKKLPIKATLLEQNVLTGIGNIYANEILFACKISPYQAAFSLNLATCNQLIKKTQTIMQQAIDKGGTTIFSFKSEPGIDGKFQQCLKVHNRQDLPCYVCKTPIKKVKLRQRGTYYCPFCQA